MNLEPYKNCLALKNAIHITNSTEAPYKPCCWYNTGVAANSWDEYRTKIDNLSTEENCKHCIDQDAAGIKSHRLHYTEVNELIIGVFFDNICNLKCVTCGPSNSSQWINDASQLWPDHDMTQWSKLQNYTNDKLEFIKTILERSDFKKLRIELYGGEPLIGKTPMEFLDWIYEQPYANKTNISFLTNGTTYQPKIEKYLDKLYLTITFSIDGVGDVFEYLRTNANFVKVQSVIDRYMAFGLGRINFKFNYTLSWLNSLHFAEFYNWILNRHPTIPVGISVVKAPEFLSINALSAEKRKEICKLALSRMQDSTIENWANLKKEYEMVMLADHESDNNKNYNIAVSYYLVKLDAIRNTNYQETFNEVIAIIET
jgi:sulfatase maturation enzyme AslB (radical SAM superfamily)